MRIFVLLFNARTENEGIHTLKVGDRNIVFMFESEDDAIRFGLMLEAQDFIDPTVEAFDSEEIEEFCEGTGYDCKLVPSGTLVVPPENNVEQTDWQPDGDSRTADSIDSISTDSTEPAEFSTSELDRIRRQLEGLL